MRNLVDEFGHKGFTCLGFPSNQFGHQTNNKAEEVLDQLKYIRPGNGYEPNFPIFARTDVNGKDALPLFTYLKHKLPVPVGEDGETLMSDPLFLIWSPVARNDISWNFEKFLVNKDGIPVKRYSRRYPTMDIKKDIQALLQNEPVAVEA
ncbi:hypothetical protein AAMO2058_000937100 [Amorphochlora amoebiformis]|uniref:Glutathione peroxidase n=1 Tax=Amorphochlora amoebiformis TaxID=1561963 RepID=A0A7S0DB34_9EUKA|mmetsp:Transcript_21508/g.33966  ORF Transcript_21508/g.33966 Transcript_21508/m.33966 type:complete len:149 (+) Transcript_21508:400-846(+)|eukprot:1341068-Amorphochlora_amoeboformis.AAC.1